MRKFFVKTLGYLVDIGGLSLIMIVVLTVISVAGRYFLKLDTIPGVYNIIERVLFPVLVFLAIPLTYFEGRFPNLEMLIEKFPSKLNKITKSVITGLEFLIYSIIFWFVLIFTIGLIQKGQQIQVGAVRWSFAPIIVLLPISFLLLAISVGYFLNTYIRKDTEQDRSIQ